jgi:phage recombination protein Bet
MNSLIPLADKLAVRLGLEISGQSVLDTLKATAFRGQVTDAQMTALLLVASQYGLNPWTREIYAFPDKNNGIVPVVGIDGWSRIINEHPQFDGLKFVASDTLITMQGTAVSCHEWMECHIYRKDRSRPIVIREYLDEVYRPPFKSDKGYMVNGPWQSHPKRFLRHKAGIQCGRIAFGFGGIYDQDEAERVLEAQQVLPTPQAVPQAAYVPWYPPANFGNSLLTWRELIEAGKKTPQQIIDTVQSKYRLSEEQIDTLNNLKAFIGDEKETGDTHEKS